MEYEYFITPEGFRKLSIRCQPLHKNQDESKLTKVQKVPSQSVRHSKALEKYKVKENDHVVAPKRPSSRNRNGRLSRLQSASSRSSGNHGNIYNVRSPDCTPGEVYLHENVRNYVNQNKLHNRRCKSADVAYRFGRTIQLPKFAGGSEFLKHEDLTMGQKQYIWGIARCYSVDGFKKAQQERMQTLLDYEFKKRMITRDICDKTKLKLWKDYCDYSKVIKNASTKGSVRPHSSFSRRVLYGHKTSQVRPHTTSACKKVENVDNNIDAKRCEDTNTENETRKFPKRPKSAKRPLYSASMGESRSSPSSLEDELVFDANEKLTLFEQLDVATEE